MKLFFQMLVWLYRQIKCHILLSIMQNVLNSEQTTIPPCDCKYMLIYTVLVNCICLDNLS